MSTMTIQPVLADRLVARSSTVTTTMLVGAGAVAVGLLAQVSIPLWPVPITGQTLGVMLVGATLGARRGALSMLSYMLLGLAGLPWFSAMSGGLAMIASPSFGYILGFIPTAYIIGYLSERTWDRRPLLAVAAFSIASIIPFMTGIPYMWLMLHLAGTTLGLMATINAGFTPFIIGGIVKMLLAAMILPGAWKAVEWVKRHTS